MMIDKLMRILAAIIIVLIITFYLEKYSPDSPDILENPKATTVITKLAFLI